MILRKQHLTGKQFTFDLSDQAKGIYLVDMNEEGKTQPIKIEVR
jgi:hypothetical protein